MHVYHYHSRRQWQKRLYPRFYFIHVVIVFFFFYTLSESVAGVPSPPLFPGSKTLCPVPPSPTTNHTTVVAILAIATMPSTVQIQTKDYVLSASISMSSRSLSVCIPKTPAATSSLATHRIRLFRFSLSRGGLSCANAYLLVRSAQYCDNGRAG